VTLARRWGAPRALGHALTTAGLLADSKPGLELLDEAVSVLADSPAQLVKARALTELGAALRRRNRRADARAPLATGLELAQRCGARALADRARDELIATGARPRRPMRSGLDALTPSERRVARLAASDQTNRDIAQALFVTEKTVETHLSHAYQKLDIHSRSQLTSALAPGTPR
jgi:DNA-binding CsgD family transcriptional regulator